jgi:hypothetical protein
MGKGQYQRGGKPVGELPMAEPIVFISRFRPRPGSGPALAEAFTRANALIDATKPRTMLYAAYVARDEAELRIVHAFPDAEAMLSHFEGADDRAATIADLVEYLGFEVYGAAPPAAIEQLRSAAFATGAELRTFPEAIGGFVRASG